MIKIIIVFLFLVILLVCYYSQMNRQKIRDSRNLFLRKILELPEEALGRKIKISSGASLFLGDIKKDPSLLEFLSWEDFDKLDGKLFRLRSGAPEKWFLREVYKLPEEALQRRVTLSSANYSLAEIKREWRKLGLEDWLMLWSNPELIGPRNGPPRPV